MSRLNELIEEFCPNGVEYRRLEEVCKITKGEQLNKTKFISSGEYPVINGGIDPSGYYNKYNKIENTITISQGGANAGYVNYIKTKFWSNAHCYTVDSVEDFMEYKYIYYFLKNSEYTLMNSQYGAGIPALSMKTLGKLEIPVPPLEIQEE
ncbi:MAG: restriction endonuclease subunit S, partial [Anaerococcus sp.]